MPFPDWAPSTLIEEYDRLRTEIANRQKLASDEDESLRAFDEFCRPERIPGRETVTQLEERVLVLHRLLTNSDMISVWTALSRPIANPQPWKKDPPLMLWNDVSRALRDFPLLMEDAQSPAEYRKSLLSIATKAKGLQASIAGSSVAKAHAEDLVAVSLQVKNLAYREARGEIPLQSEYDMPLTMLDDCDEAMKNREVRWCNFNQGFIDDYEWSGATCRWHGGSGIGRSKRGIFTLTNFCNFSLLLWKHRQSNPLRLSNQVARTTQLSPS